MSEPLILSKEKDIEEMDKLIITKIALSGNVNEIEKEEISEDHVTYTTKQVSQLIKRIKNL